MPSSDERRKTLRAAIAAEFFFNVLTSPNDYVRGQSSVVKRLASIDAVKIIPPKTESQILLYRIDQKLSLIIGMLAENSSRKNYIYHGTTLDISECGLGFAHDMLMETGTILEIGITLPGPEGRLMDIAGKVVHVKKPATADAGYASIYGVEFFDIVSKDQTAIMQWIFTQQREQIRRRRENVTCEFPKDLREKMK